MRHVLMVLLFAVLISHAAATPEGGVVYLHDPDDTLAWSPLLCSSEICQQVQRLVLPSLFVESDSLADVRLSTGADTALATEVVYSPDGKMLTVTLREDLLWEDGTPVTAYDVFYSYLVLGMGAGEIIPLDAKTLMIETYTPSCMLYRLQMTVLPAHALQADFVAQAEAFDFTAEQTPSDQIDEWLLQHPWNPQAAQHPYHITLPVTLMNREMSLVSPGDYLRVELGTGDDGVALHIYNNLPTAPAVDYFLAGQLDVLRDAPFNRWPDLLNAPDTTLYRRLTGRKTVLVMNLASPVEDRPYKDQFGNLVPQIPHPMLSDLRVRQAIAAAIDVNELIEVGLNGFGLPTDTIFSITDDPTSPPVSHFNPALAESLLTEVGWIRPATGHDTIRRCQGCAGVEEGTALTLEILYAMTGENQAIVAALTKQLARVGIDLAFRGMEISGNGPQLNDRILIDQYFDLALWEHSMRDNRLAERFLTENDGYVNDSSYTNPDVDELLKVIDNPTAAHACDATQLRDLYAEAEEKIMVDLPEIPLFEREEIFVVRNWVLNVESNPLLDPLFSADQWQVYYGPQDRK